VGARREEQGGNEGRYQGQSSHGGRPLVWVRGATPVGRSR
jgi:hypothetical protein